MPSVVELVVYLRHCARVARLDDVLSMLGNAEQFGRAFVQLAFGTGFFGLASMVWGSNRRWAKGGPLLLV